MTTKPDDGPTRVGQHLAARRNELDLTQGEVARRVGVTVTSVSAAERGKSTIMRGKRRSWEQALRLKAGTLNRAYNDGTDLEPADAPTEPPYADMSNPKEAAVWALDLPASDRIEIIDAVRARAAQQNNHRRTG